MLCYSSRKNQNEIVNAKTHTLLKSRLQKIETRISVTQKKLGLVRNTQTMKLQTKFTKIRLSKGQRGKLNFKRNLIEKSKVSQLDGSDFKGILKTCKLVRQTLASQMLSSSDKKNIPKLARESKIRLLVNLHGSITSKYFYII